jgi:hypothetical protein
MTINPSGDYVDAKEAQTIVNRPIGNVYINSNTNNSTTTKTGRLISPPPAPEKFGGRDEELLDLKTRLRAGQDVALTAVRGLGGIGKTAVARQLAHDLFYNPDEKLFQAVLWKEIKRRPDPLRLLLDWAYMIEPAFIYNKDLDTSQLALIVKAMLENLITEKVASVTADQFPNSATSSHSAAPFSNTLIIFDDVWDDGLEAVKLLRQACPEGAAILITTRSGRIAPLISANEVFLDKLEPEHSVNLLLQYLPDTDPALLKQLAIVLGGHPLAMSLAAKRLLLQPKQAQATILKQHLEEYKEGLPIGAAFSELELEQGEEKEENLTTALYYSYSELNAQEQDLFKALGVLPSNVSFDNKMLKVIWNLKSDDQVQKTFNRLRLLSLLDIDAVMMTERGGQGGWYRQHPLVQSYARALLRQ